MMFYRLRKKPSRWVAGGRWGLVEFVAVDGADLDSLVISIFIPVWFVRSFASILPGVAGYVPVGMGASIIAISTA